MLFVTPKAEIYVEPSIAWLIGKAQLPSIKLKIDIDELPTCYIPYSNLCIHGKAVAHQVRVLS